MKLISLITLPATLFLLLAAASSEGFAAPVYNPANGHYYDAIPLLTNWHGAKAHAEAQCYRGLPGHLVTITSAEENDFIVANFPQVRGTQTEEYWIGAFQPPDSPEPRGNWQWITGEPFEFPNWSPSEPNNAGGNEDAAHYYAGSADGRWNDRPSSDAMAGYVIEYEPLHPKVLSAVEIVFPTRLGTHYQLQVSTDFNAWTDFGPLVLGTGAEQSVLAPTRPGPKQFFRVEPIDLLCGLAAHYPLDGNANDASGNGNGGETMGVTFTTNRFGVPNSACAFDGTRDSFIRVPDSPSLAITNAISIVAWINFDIGGDFHPRIVSKVTFELLTQEASEPARRLSFRGQDVGTLATPTELLQAGQWTLAAATYDGRALRLYVDGVLVIEAAAAGSLATSGEDLNIGRNADNGSDNYRGLIDDVRIYDRALSAREIQYLFRAPE